MTGRPIILRLSNTGEPVNNTAVQNGVLILPSVALPKDYKKGDALFNLHLTLNAASAVSNNGTIFSNVPREYSTKFDRSKFYEYPLDTSFHRDILVNIPISKPGSYCYYICYEDKEQKKRTTDKFYFVVPPNLSIGNEYVPFNNINIQSVISKWIGPLDQWNALFEDISKKGYNMIHFTPLQERGVSNSPYSIYDQLRFDPNLFKSNDDAAKFLKELLAKNNLLSLTDVVLNHTANNSEWIREYPDAGYNVENSPHLQSAIELDEKLLEFSNKLDEFGLPEDIKTQDDLNAIADGIVKHVVNPLKLWQYYVFDKQESVDALKNAFENGNSKISPGTIPSDIDSNNIKQLSKYILETCNTRGQVILEDRFANKLDSAKFLAVLFTLLDYPSNKVDFETISSKASSIIDEINLDLYAVYDDDVKSIKNQLKDRIRYMRLDNDGPKLGPVSKDNPLTEPYFTRFKGADGKQWALANNGWIWGGNPLQDFASSESKAYLRREVVIWGDCVKLRYGSKEEDSPHLWKRMIDYTKECASVFDGFRIDNCHSTPLHVGEKLLDVARSVNPDLYIVAELFSGSEEMDKVFVERLGINSLIREAMQAGSVSELSTLVHKHGGRPIGSLTWLPLDEFAYPALSEPEKDKYGDSYSELEIPKALTSLAPHALFMDCTHDNEMPAQKRTVEDTLPNAALVAFCSSAIGSVFGFDECYPELLNVVDEKRIYTYGENGIGSIKQKLHSIRKSLATESDDILRDHEMYIHHEGQYITIQRHNSRTGKGWFLIARTKFNDNAEHQTLSPSVLGGTKVKNEFAYTLKKVDGHQRDDKKLTGIPVALEEIPAPEIEYNDKDSKIHVNESFIPGSIAVFSTEIPKVDVSLDTFVREGAVEASLDLDLYDLNALMYRAEPEERDASDGSDGVYQIPKHGSLIYAGFEGWISVLKNVIWQNDLAHPLCDHLREGEWPLDYVVNRLNKYSQGSKSLQKFQDWLSSRIEAIRIVPYFLRPHYFALVIGVAYEACRFRILRLFPKEIQDGTNFVQSLALTSVQMVAKMRKTSLKSKEQVPCIAAGLPHFSNDYMRCWGRDVFISFRGLLLAPGRYEDAKQHILGFAQTLKHGLIPNLLDSGRNPRYNARDAAWFFIQAIQDYVTHAPNGTSILDEKVARRFPLDDTYIPYDDQKAFSYETSVRDIIFEILQRHAKGIKYREANAGKNLDSQMSDEGFNVEVHIDWQTGLVHGGSQSNCGTWMDKMGESEKAGSKGVPGTPRDGAAVELQGLLKSALRFVNILHKENLFEYTEVEREDGSAISLKDWEKLILNNFERCFYVPEDPSHDSEYEIDSLIVNRRGIYKDLYKSGKPFEDYQLRANFPIAMVVAPELFTPSKALHAICVADKVIRGPVGMRTLDPYDWNYRPNYNNGEDSDDFATSKGRNYHQGPEWVWCMGYFLRAFLLFHYVNSNEYKEGKDPSVSVLTALNERLQGHMKWIRESEWSGLTELTNKDGAICPDSSPTQAWSSSCLLDLYFDLWNDQEYP